jgi:hypothetical protein
MTVGARNSVPSFGPPSCMRPEPGSGGGVGYVSLASLSLGGLGEAAADDVAVLPAPMAFLETVWRPGWLPGATASFFGAVGARAGAEGAAGACSRTGANLFAVGEAGTEGGCSFCSLCCCWWCMKKDCVAVEGD